MHRPSGCSITTTPLIGLKAFLDLTMLLGTHYLAVYFKVTKGHSATCSGTDILPFMFCVGVAAGGSGSIIGATGHFWHFIFGSPPLDLRRPRSIMHSVVCERSPGPLPSALEAQFMSTLSTYTHVCMVRPRTDEDLFFLKQNGILVIAFAGTIPANDLWRYFEIYAPVRPTRRSTKRFGAHPKAVS